MATWTNGTLGRLVGGTHRIRGLDVIELADAINRRRRLVYLAPDDFSGQAAAGLPVRAALIATALGGAFTSFRHNVNAPIVNAQAGVLGGTPPTPAAMEWLWPVADGDEGKVIVNGYGGIGDGQVSLYRKMNGTDAWTDWALAAGETFVRAVHVNELRWCLERLIRGRWRLPVYAGAGITSLLPDMPWLQGAIYNDGTDELRCLGSLVVRLDDPPRGLAGVEVRPGTALWVTASENCSVEVYRCCRAIDFAAAMPTWLTYAPGQSWQVPGGLGAADAVYAGAVACAKDQPAALGGPGIEAAVQAMVDGAPQILLLRRGDAGPETIDVSAELSVAFELRVPPN